MGSKRTVMPRALAWRVIPAQGAFGVVFGVAVATEVVEGGVLGEHVPDRGQVRVFECDQGFLLAQAGHEAQVAGAEVGGVAGAGGGRGGGAQGGAQPAVAVASAAGLVLAGGFVVLRDVRFGDDGDVRGEHENSRTSDIGRMLSRSAFVTLSS
jgi:hypothetical protein